MKIPALSAIQWAAGAAALIAALVLLWNFDPFHRRERAEQKAATATVQAEVNAATAEITSDVAVKTTRIHRKAQEAKDALASSTDYDGDLAIWSDGIDGVLDGGQRPPNEPPRVPQDPSGEPG